MILITVAPVGYRGNWSASIDDRIVCPSVRWPLVAAAKALLAEGHAPDTEIAMKHRGSPIVAMQGKISTLAALTHEAATGEGPLPPETGSQDGDLDNEGITLPEMDEGRSRALRSPCRDRDGCDALPWAGRRVMRSSALGWSRSSCSRGRARDRLTLRRLFKGPEIAAVQGVRGEGQGMPRTCPTPVPTDRYPFSSRAAMRYARAGA
jgi:hypothetical protein